MSDERWTALMAAAALELTDAEWSEGWHFCCDWHGLLIGPGMEEVNHCSHSGARAKCHKPVAP